MSKEFDCVEMKQEAAEKIKKRIGAFSTKGELAFWKSQTELLKRRQRECLEKQNVKR